MKRILLLAVAFLLSAVGAFAVDITPNSVYRLQNNKGTYLTVSGSNAVTAAYNATDQKQEWYFAPNDDGTGFYLRNVSSGAYLTSPLVSQNQWSLRFATEPTPDNMLMAFRDYENMVIFSPLAHATGNNFAHSDGSNNVVCWKYDGSPNTKWTLVKVEKSDAELKSILDRFHSVADEIAKSSSYETHLAELFTDKACTVLRPGVTLAGNEHYEALSQPLKAMVDKIASGLWDETCVYGGVKADWDDLYARKYRVQLYEPFSEGAASASMAGIQAYTNMNNPTGIVADAGDMLYVMVNDPVPAGATLYINAVPDCQMYNSTTAGTRLQQGLNIVNCVNDNAHYFIYYTVACASGGKPTAYKVTDFTPIRIHIEGGRLNGFFNHVGDDLYAKDTRDDFVYTCTRATHPMYDFLGKYVILHFHLNDTPSQDGGVPQKCVKSALITNPTAGSDREYDPVKIMEAWDHMCFAERILMGIMTDKDIADPYNLDYYESIVGKGYSKTVGDKVYSADPGFYYADYFNNRMMGISQQGDLFMNATSWRTAYNVSTVDAILTQFPSGQIWGPAHEYGHMNQAPMKMAGTTEVSNNIFSNVATYYTNTVTSRSDFMSTQLKVFLDGGTFLDNALWGTTRMFWQLWCYYHATGHNKKFYPRLYELLRHNPLKLTTIQNGNHNEKDDMLHFAKMCCIAAEEDLTNFFTAWSFFTPLTGYHIGDYDEFNAVLSPEDIAAVKAEIKSYGFPVNNQIILIDDRPGSTRASYSGFDKKNAGDFGGLDDFRNGAAPSSDLSYTVTGNTVNVTGDPGAGFLIFDEDGDLLAFSNSASFDVTPDIAARLLDGSVTCNAVGTAGETAQVTNTLLDGDDASKRAMLSQACDAAKAELDFIDPSATKVGYYYESSCEDLRKAYAEAVEALADQNASGDTLTEKIKTLSDAYNALMAVADDAKIKIEEGCAYVLTNLGRVGALSTAGATVGTVQPAAAFTSLDNQWFLELQPSGQYRIRNYTYDTYINSPASGSTTCTMGTAELVFTLVPNATRRGYFALQANGASGSSLHLAQGGNVIFYSNTDPSNWAITLASSRELVAERNLTSDLLEYTDALLAEAGTVEVGDSYPVNFTVDSFYSNAPYTAGAAGSHDNFSSWNVLLDGNFGTYFCSDYSGADSADGIDHYIRMEYPGEGSFRHINLWYSSLGNITATGNIQAYRVDASLDGKTWYPVTSAATTTVKNTVYNTGEVTVPVDTRYLRYVVTRTGNAKGGHYAFAVSGIGVQNASDVITPSEALPYVTADDIKEVMKQRDLYSLAAADPAKSLAELSAARKSLSAADDNLSALMNIPTGIGQFSGDAPEGAPIYYDLQGRRVLRPDRGIYIRILNGRATKLTL